VSGTDGEGVNLRASPSATARVLRVVPEGATLTGAGETQKAEGLNWQKVRDSDGRVGWVAATYVLPI
jgi:SH3-like domain-containing protein